MCEYCFNADGSGFGKDMLEAEIPFLDETLRCSVGIDMQDNNTLKLYAGITEANDLCKIKINFCPLCGRKLE